MAKSKLLHLAEIFMTGTDDNHGLTMAQIIGQLTNQGIPAERKTLYDDFEQLRSFGMDIIATKVGRNTDYRLASRDFELVELKLLVDSVQASRFITERKSRQLISKLEKLCSRYEAGRLNRQILNSGRVKTINESIYYNVDTLHEAINRSKQIDFYYFNWNEKKQKAYRNNQKRYEVSPWHLIWDSENYYLIAYDMNDKKIKHFRVDKIENIRIVDKPCFIAEGFDVTQYAGGMFGMFGGAETETVTLLCDNYIANVIIDRFGKEIFIKRISESQFETYVKVTPSEQFFGWVVGLGGAVKITEPQEVVEKMKNTVNTLAEQYK